MILVIKVQSFSDVITNSSSELFVIKSTGNTGSKQEIQNLIDNHCSSHYWKGDYKDFQALPLEERRKWDICSGDGGCHDVTDSYDRYLQWLEHNKTDSASMDDLKKDVPYEVYLKYFTSHKNDIFVNIDHSYLGTINYILENFFVTDHLYEYGYYEIDPGTKRLLKKLTKEEWEKLPKERRSDY